jgi:hypothetical protein
LIESRAQDVLKWSHSRQTCPCQPGKIVTAVAWRIKPTGLGCGTLTGYDVTAAVTLWRRSRENHGEFDPISKFFWNDHSRATDRIKNIERELRLNYTAAGTR